MKKIIYLIGILSIVLVGGCEEPCKTNASRVNYLKIGLKDKEGVVYMRVEGPSDFGILYGDLVQFECSNSRNRYDGIAIDVTHFSVITEEEYNKNSGLTRSETIAMDTTLTY